MKCDWRARRTSSNVDVKITALLSLAFFAGPQLQLRASKAASSALLHRSPIPTYYFQDSLLRLPVPTLEETLDKWVSVCRACDSHCRDLRLPAQNHFAESRRCVKFPVVKNDSNRGGCNVTRTLQVSVLPRACS